MLELWDGYQLRGGVLLELLPLAEANFRLPEQILDLFIRQVFSSRRRRHNYILFEMIL